MFHASQHTTDLFSTSMKTGNRQMTGMRNSVFDNKLECVAKPTEPTWASEEGSNHNLDVWKSICICFFKLTTVLLCIACLKLAHEERQTSESCRCNAKINNKFLHRSHVHLFWLSEITFSEESASQRRHSQKQKLTTATRQRDIVCPNWSIFVEDLCPCPLDGISLGRGRGIPRNSSLPIGTREFLGKGRGQMPEKILWEPRKSLKKFLQSSFAWLRTNSLPPKFSDLHAGLVQWSRNSTSTS